MSINNKHVAFLRGINVGGHHKVPMVELRTTFEELGLKNIETILNSGNVIFESDNSNLDLLEKEISKKLASKFGFSIPTILRKVEFLNEINSDSPFANITITKDIRLYISFLKNDVSSDLKLPWSSDDKSYQILEKRDDTIISVLDLSLSNSPKAMTALEKFYGKEITTRNWKTIERILKK